MKIIKTAQLSGLLGKADQLVDAIDGAEHLDPHGVELDIDGGAPEEHGHEDPGLSRSGDYHHDGHLAGDGDEGGETFDDTDAVMGDEHDQMGVGGGDLGGDLGGLGDGGFSMDVNIDPMGGDGQLGGEGHHDIGVEVNPDPERGELPLDVEVDGHELPIDDLVDDHNDPSLGLDELGDGHTGEFDEMSLDGDLNGHMDTQDLHNTAHDGTDLGGGSELGVSHDPVDQGDDAGLDGLLVLDDENQSHLSL